MAQGSSKKRRLRKKLYLQEFAILGFKLNIDINSAAAMNSQSFFDDLIALLNERKLFLNIGDCHGRFNGFISSAARYGSATKQDLDAIKSLLDCQALVASYQLGELRDVFYR